MKHSALCLTCLLVICCAACAPRAPRDQVVYDPALGVHVSKGGQVIPSASANVSGVTLGATPGGGYVGTRLGPIRLSAGF